MKQFLAFLSLFLITIGLSAQSFTVDGLTYSVLSETDKTVKVSDGKNATGDIVVPETVNYNDVEYSVTTIGYQAFYGNKNITSIDMMSITTLESYSFYKCSSISSVNLPCATSIGSYAFYDCSNISSLRIGSAEQWCNVNFGNSDSYPLQYTSQQVDLYIGDSESPATSVELPSTVTEIPDCAFSNTTITSFSAPCATSIGSSAFSSCSSLSSVSLPSATSIGSSAFYSCSSLSSVSLPSATSIGSAAFSSCSSLSSVNLPCATSIGSSAFSYCSINSLRIGSVEQYCSIDYADKDVSAWSYQYQFPLQGDRNMYIYIGDSETPATEITIPASVQQVPSYAFRGTSIHTIHFEGTNPPTLMSTNAFPAWTMLAVPEEAYEIYLAADGYKDIPLQITIDGHLTKVVDMEADATTSKLLMKIGEDEIGKIVNLTIRGTINSYDMMIIRNQMTSLRNLDLTDARIVDCDFVYSNAGGVNYHSQEDVITADWLSGIVNVKLPATTKSIGSNAFKNCDKLVSVTIPDGVTSIGNSAFDGCSRLKEVTLPQSLTSIGEFVFYECRSLKEIVIPDGTTSIGYCAFRSCSNLEKVTIPTSVTSIGYWAFMGTQPLELHINSLEAWCSMNNGSEAFSNVCKLYIGDSDEPVEDIVIPEGTTSLKSYTFTGFKSIKSVSFSAELTTIGSGAFQNCTGLTEIKLPENVKTINSYTFSGCSNLENVEFTDSIKSIGSYAFEYCSKLTKIELPAYLQTIGGYAFRNCSNLTEVLIPASIKEIKDYAFQSCPNLNRVIATTVEPIVINQNTFSTYKTASLFTPKTSYYKYYWNTQWNQFLYRKEYDNEFAKSFGYKYFYLNGKNGDNFEDFMIDDATGPLHGVIDPEFGYPPVMKAPDADFNEGAGFIVSGEQIQELGDIHLHHNGNNGASIIAKAEGKVHIDNLYVDIKVQPNRWYFFCFPFDINPGEAKFGGSHVWYLYDGEARAMNGNGGWKKVAADGVMKSGYGYIFQGAVNGTLSIHVADLTIDASDRKTNMITYQSENKNDASWNLVGNSNPAYYGINDLMLGEVPVTVYDNETGNYVAVRPGDDDYEFYPFQAFFVQKPEGIATMDFDAAKQETKNMADKSMAVRARARAAKKVDSARKIINLEIALINASADSVASAADRTRIVLNPKKSINYETDCDAAKFISDRMPQIYSLDNEGCAYAINERPVENGVISIAVQVPEEGFYAISASRLDSGAKLRDLETGSEVDLAKGGYTFDAKAMIYTNRFQLILSDGATSITTPEEAMDIIAVETGAISVKDASADVKVYSVGGILVASQKGAGNMKVPAGVYVVNVNGQSVKVTVNE